MTCQCYVNFDPVFQHVFFRKFEIVGGKHSYDDAGMDPLPLRGSYFLQTIFEKTVDDGGQFAIANNPRGRDTRRGLGDRCTDGRI